MLCVLRCGSTVLSVESCHCSVFSGVLSVGCFQSCIFSDKLSVKSFQWSIVRSIVGRLFLLEIKVSKVFSLEFCQCIVVSKVFFSGMLSV